MKTIYVGIDVHKDSMSVHALNGKTGEIVLEKTIPYDFGKLDKELKKLNHPKSGIKVCYESGCMGFELSRHLNGSGVHCDIISPSKIPTQPGEKTKTDKRDALKLANLYAGGQLTSIVYVPSPNIEAARSITRLREDARVAEHKARQQLLGFCLRKNKAYRGGGLHWTNKHFIYLRNLKFEDHYEQFTFEAYLAEVNRQKIRLAELDEKIKEIAKTSQFSKQVSKLRTFKGLDYYSALSILLEIGDFNRFETANHFASFIGLVPGQKSSGKKVRMTGITKTGNGFLRKLLNQASQSYRYKSQPSVRISSKRAGQPIEIIEYSEKCQRRCEKKYARLLLRNKCHKLAVTAVSRELSCFIWGLMTNNIAA